MKKDVLISIKGNICAEGELGLPDVLEFITEGKLYHKNDKYYLIYEESTLTGMKGTTTLKVEENIPKRVTLYRRGGKDGIMIFEQGVKHLTHYDTGMGIFNVTVNTHAISSSIKETGGDLHIKYSIDVNSQFTGSNHINISVKEANFSNDKFNQIS